MTLLSHVLTSQLTHDSDDGPTCCAKCEGTVAQKKCFRTLSSGTLPIELLPQAVLDSNGQRCP
eukprot:164833-Amphidinium_carterae.1